MPYVLFVVTPAPGLDTIPLRTWEQFAQEISTLSLQSAESKLLNRGCWQLDLSSDGAAFHSLITAAKEAGASYRYLLTEGPLSWVHSQ